MTAFVRTAAGNWSDPTKWDIGAGYPNGISDDADLATFAVVADVDCAVRYVETGTASSLTVGTGRTITVHGAVRIRSGATLDITGTLAGPIGGTGAGLIIYGGATITAHNGVEYSCLNLWAVGSTLILSDIIKDCSGMNMATNGVYADAGSQMTIDGSISARAVWAFNAGTLAISAGVTLKMITDGAVLASAGGKFDINGTRASPVHIEPRVAGEAWYLYLYGGATGSDIDYLICTGNPWTFGDSTDGFVIARKPQKTTPVHRLPEIDDDPILGRGASRIHYKGNRAAIVEISGIWAVADAQYERVDTMMDKGSIVGYASDEVFIPNARIVDHEYERVRGQLYWPYTITLIEDV